MTSFTPPRAITPQDDVTAFRCGEQSLDNWLTLRAIKNELAHTSRTLITVERESNLVAGYYCLSSSLIARDEAGRSLGGHGTPDPIPVIIIGRLAVDERFAGHGLGASLLQDAVIKGIEASRLVGSRAILVHALNDDAAAFYRKFGFRPVPSSSRVLYVLTTDAEATVSSLV